MIFLVRLQGEFELDQANAREAHLIGFVVRIDEERLPVAWQSFLVDSKSMVLRGDECLPVHLVHDRLVVPSANTRRRH